MDIRPLRDLPEVEVARISEGTSLDRWMGNWRRNTRLRVSFYSQPRTYLMVAVPVRDGQMIGELPILIHEIILIPRQKRGQNQLHLQLSHFHPRTRMHTGPPTKERIGSVRRRVRSQPPTEIVLVRCGIVLGVQVDVTQGIDEEISPFDHLLANFYPLTKVPSEGDTGNGNSL